MLANKKERRLLFAQTVNNKYKDGLGRPKGVGNKKKVTFGQTKRDGDSDPAREQVISGFANLKLHFAPLRRKRLAEEACCARQILVIRSILCTRFIRDYLYP